MAQRDVLDDALDNTLSPPLSQPQTHDILDAALASMNAPPQIPHSVLSAAPEQSWGPLAETGNAALLGAGTRIKAGANALARAAQLSADPRYAGVPFGELVSRAYNDNLMHIDQARENYQNDNPGTSLLGNLAGGALPTAAAIAAGQEYAVAPMARSLARIAPKFTPAIDFLTGTLPKDASWLAKLASRTITGAAAGATAGGVQAGLSDKPIGEQIGTGALTGAVMNPTAGATLDAIGSHVLPRVAAQARTLMDNGVKIQPGQIPGVSPIINWLHKNLSDASGATQRTQLTQALSRTFGENSPVIDNGLIKNAETRIGGMFEKFGNATIQKDNQLGDSIVNTLADAHGDLGNGTGIPEDKLKALRDVGGLIANAGDKNSIPGSVYLNLTKRGSTLDRLTRDPDVGVHAAQLRDALDGALERSVAGASGRWVPAGQAANAPAGATAIPQPNRLIAPSGAKAEPLLQSTTLAKPGPAQGYAETGPGGTTRPGMVWEIDPATQGALQTLRDARGQYKNLILARGLVNDSTGGIQPSTLAKRIGDFYPPNRYSGTPTQWERSILDLAPASQFIPNASTGAKTPNKLLGAVHGGVGAVAALAGEHFIEHSMNDPLDATYKLGIGLLGYGAAKAGTSMVDSPTMTASILRAAQRAPSFGAALTPNLLLTPPAVQAYNRERKPKK